MKGLSDAALDHLRTVTDLPDLSGTRYRVVRKLARGGMGSVYVVEDVELGREIALKVVSAPGAPAEIEERLRREARVLAGLEHPNIVPVHDVGRLPDGRSFYVMKLVRGQRLDEWARTGRSRAEILRLYQKVCEAVAFGNAHGVVHRDLKPDNVMVGPFGEALVMDWGIAKVLAGEPVASAPGPAGEASPGATLEGAILGTPGYMAPEQAAGDNHRIGPRTDVYALGAILYFLLAGRPPHAGRTPLEVVHSVLKEPPPPLRRLDPRVPRALEAIVEKALRKDPDGRYGSALDLAADIDRFLDGSAPSAHRETIVDKTGRFIAKNKILLLLVLAYLVARGLVMIFANR
ncbi:MAG: serine/threonine protein kinase [Deltaproteobacteria bacterium]|nr:serine/threonine protein kinase [Deltaproteobacteria bacterium]